MLREAHRLESSFSRPPSATPAAGSTRPTPAVPRPALAVISVLFVVSPSSGFPRLLFSWQAKQPARQPWHMQPEAHQPRTLGLLDSKTAPRRERSTSRKRRRRTAPSESSPRADVRPHGTTTRRHHAPLPPPRTSSGTLSCDLTRSPIAHRPSLIAHRPSRTVLADSILGPVRLDNLCPVARNCPVLDAQQSQHSKA